MRLFSSGSSIASFKQKKESKEIIKLLFKMKQPGGSGNVVFWFYFAAILGVGSAAWWHTMAIPKSPLPIEQIAQLELNRAHLNRARPKSGYHLTFTVAYEMQGQQKLNLEETFQKVFESALSERAYFRIDFVEKYHVKPFVPLPKDRRLNEEELKVFVNGMGIEDGDEDPLRQLTPINFVFYVPHASRSNDGLAFVYPKWGGVYINHLINKSTLEEAFKVFAYQLRNGIRLGLELSLQDGIEVSIAHAIDSLQSLISSLHSSPNIPIGPQIAHQSEASLRHLAQAQNTANDLEMRYEHAVLAAEWAEKAFFDPSMLASQYFPDEHKMAVYFPIIIPALVPLVATLKAKFLPKK